MPWKHTEGLLTLRWWPESVFPGFSKMHHFCPADGPRTKSFRGKFRTPFFSFDGYGLTLNLSGNKRVGEIWTKTRISTPMPPFWQGKGTNYTLDPKHNILCRSVTVMYKNHWVTSDVQFRKGVPPFWAGLGWADLGKG